MIIEFKLPELGENIASADITKILVKPGDRIAVNQPILEIETDKATIEVPAENDGVVKEIKAVEGKKAEIGSVILIIETEETAGKERDVKTESPVETQKTTTEQKTETPKNEQKVSGSSIVEFRLPELGENIHAVEVNKILVNPGDKIRKDQILLEIETDKATIEVPAEHNGII